MSIFALPLFGCGNTQVIIDSASEAAVTVTVAGTLRADSEFMTGNVSVTVTVTEKLSVDEGDVIISVLVGGSLIDSGDIDPDVPVKVTAGGALIASSHPTTTPEGRYDQNGSRPFTPVLVHVTGVRAPYDLPSGLQVGQSFLMADDYLPVGDTLNLLGAVQNSIGTKVGTDLYVFRQPRDYEVVWHVSIDSNGDAVGGKAGDHGLLRFNGDVWLVYQSAPERAYAAMTSFYQADPDEAWLYVFRLIGSIECQQQHDATDMLDARDPFLTPERYLPIVAGQNGVRLPEGVSTAFKRRLIATAIEGHLQRGYPAEIERRLRLLGYSATVWEVWAQAVSEDNFEAVEDAPAWLYTTLNNMGIRKLVEEDSGQKGMDVALWPHSYFTQLPSLTLDLGYTTLTLDEFNSLTLEEFEALDLSGLVYAPKYPTTRIAIELSYANGEPLPTDLDRVQMRQISNTIARTLRPVLPAHIDIRFILAPADAVEDGEAVTVTDSFSATDA